MRNGIFYGGLAVLLVGLVVFAIAAVGAGQAAAAFAGCMNGYQPNPFNPTPYVPPACSNAFGAIAMYGGLEVLGGALGFVGVIILVIGLVLQPERPMPAAMPYYPPPVYGAPPGYPPQGPQAPPPQP